MFPWYSRVLGLSCLLCFCTVANPSLADVYIRLGDPNGSDLEFKQVGYVTNAVNIGVAGAATNFPKEMNTSWWTVQPFYFSLATNDVSSDLLVHLDPYWNDGSGTLTMALEVYSGGSWQEVGRTAVCSVISGGLAVPAAKLAVGRNDMRLRTVSSSGGTGNMTWDQIVVRTRPPASTPDPNPAWFSANTHAWAKEDWGGITTITQVQYQGRSCLRVNAQGSIAYIRTEKLLEENWELPILGMQGDIFLVSTSKTARVKLEMKDRNGNTIEAVYAQTLQTNVCNNLTWIFATNLDYSAIAGMIIAMDSLGTAGSQLYIDNLKLTTTAGEPRLWDDFDSNPMRWTVTSDQAVGYDDSVDFNTNGANDSVTANEYSGPGGGSIYLPWNAAVTSAPYAKVFNQEPLRESWTGVDGISFKAKVSTTNAKLWVAFIGSTNYVETPPLNMAQSNVWLSYRLSLPRTEIGWTNMQQLSFLVLTTNAPTGTLFVDDIRLHRAGPIAASVWSIGKENGSGAEFEPASTKTNYVVDYQNMTAYQSFPDRQGDSNRSLTLAFKMAGGPVARVSRLAATVVPSASQGEVRLTVLAGAAATNVGTLVFNPAQGLISASVDIPSNTFVIGTNRISLVKQGTGGQVLFDYLDFQSLHSTSNLYDAIADNASREWQQGYVFPITTNWYPLQTIHFTSYNMIRNIGLYPDEERRMFFEPEDAAGFAVMQRTTGQWAGYPFNLYRYEMGNRYKMFPYDLDDWDWSEAESNDLRMTLEFSQSQLEGDPWGPLDHTEIPAWSQYSANLEVLDENPPGSESWPWNCAVRAVGYLKLSSAFASHAPSPRMPFFNVLNYYGPGDWRNEEQSRLPEVYSKVNNDQEIVFYGKMDGSYANGAFEMKFGNLRDAELGYCSRAQIRTRTCSRRDWDLSDVTNRICLAGIASMFWKDEDDSPWDSTDQSHDSDMVMIVRTNGTFASHELGQFPAEWTDECAGPGCPITNMTDAAPYVYNLGPVTSGDVVYVLQQDRNIDHYRALNLHSLDYNPQFQGRGSLSYKILKTSRRVVVKVYECHPWLDTWDNEVISLEVDPTETDVLAGEPLDFDYEMTAFVTPGVFFTDPNTGVVSKVIDNNVTLKYDAYHPSGTNLIASIDLDYTANGLTWTPIATNVPNTGSYNWNISSVPATSVWVRIRGRADDGTLGWDVTDSKLVFSTAAAQTGLTVQSTMTNESMNLQYNGTTKLIQWNIGPTSGVSQVAFVKLQYSTNGTNWTDLATREPNDGSYLWDLAAVPAGTYRVRVYGQAADGTFQYDLSDGTLAVTNFQSFPILIGTNNASDGEFNQNGNTYTNGVYDANRSFVWRFPKELGLNYWRTQDIAVAMTPTVMTQGMQLVLDPAWNNGAGALNVAVSLHNGEKQTLLDTLPMIGTNPASVAIPANLLRTGTAKIRLTAVSATYDTYATTWDQIRIVTIPPLNLVLGQKDGSELEFASSNYERVFNADTMTVSQFPKELNTIWWTNQDIRVTLGATTADRGLRVHLDSMWADGLGLL
ncbi:MAG: hypothetical protein BWK77_01540 [Verrucomicrobia bacterium A1]|nr:MAG: hypothetical protein BWK77_01540 [Verrucomicrobia bacterium A1]